MEEEKEFPSAQWTFTDPTEFAATVDFEEQTTITLSTQKVNTSKSDWRYQAQLDDLSMETIASYSKYIRVFDGWCKSRGIKHFSLKEKDFFDFVIHMNTELLYSDNTKRLCLAALKYKLNKCEKRDFTFHKSRKRAKQVNPHKAHNKEELQEIFNVAANKLDVDVKVHLLYDMAARI